MSNPFVGFFTRRIDDARAAGVYARSLWGLWSISRRRHGLEGELGLAWRQIGQAGERAQVGQDLPAWRAVRDARGALTQTQAQLDRHQGDLASAQDKHKREAARHDEILAPLQAARGQLCQDETAASAARIAAQQRVDQVQRDIQSAQSQAAGGQGQPASQSPQAIGQQLAGLQQALGAAGRDLAAATRRHQQTVEAAARKQAELDQAQQARRAAMAQCEQEVAACQKAVREAGASVGVCETALAVAHGGLGQAILSANLSGAQIDSSVAAARAVMGQVSVVSARSSQTRAQADAARGGAVRSAGALGVLVVAVGLTWMLVAHLARPRQGPAPDGPDRQAALPAAPARAGEAVANLPAGQAPARQAGTPAGGAGFRPPASTEVSPALEKAILALPPLTQSACKVAGKLTVTRADPRSGSARALWITLPVEVRPSVQGASVAGQAQVRLLVDLRDRILSSEVMLPDPDLAELEELSRK